MRLTNDQEERLKALCHLLVNPERARIVVPAMEQSTGFWFGGGNMVESPDGRLHLVGRYRNFGDSRSGVGLGERGLELAIFSSEDKGRSFEKSVSFSKSDLNIGDREVLSIEGSALNITPDGVELFVSTEKSGIGYPAGFESFLKPGTGVWTIERLFAKNIKELVLSVKESVLESNAPEHLHLKDPFVYTSPSNETVLLFCHHPFSWSSSNTGYCVRKNSVAEFSAPIYDFFPRGSTWDVAMTRGTAVFDVPRVGTLAESSVSLMFYDGGESLRNLDEHANAVTRPRGYSCEELGGAGYFVDGKMHQTTRLSTCFPIFVSPYGTGCSRYVDVLSTSQGVFTTWQLSQDDLSQPLVMTHTTHEEIEAVLE